ncbi:Zinc-finger double domain-containing protein [Cladophialophora immunda]|nr:Zinc-finger double domain-containing protein [Cladophialophora immunda]
MSTFLPDPPEVDCSADPPLGIPTTARKRYCPYCSREFHKTDHYNRHVRSHTNERPFGCNICGKFYSRRDTLSRHVKTHRLRQQDERSPSATSANDIHENNQVSSPSQLIHETSARGPFFSQRAPQEVDFEPAGVTVDSIGSNGPEDVASTSSGAVQRNNGIEDSHSPPTGPRPWADGQVFDYGSATTSVDLGLSDGIPLQIQATNVQDPETSRAVITNPFSPFDASNWLLDDTFVDMFDVGNDGLAWNRLRSSARRTHSRPPSSSIARKSSKVRTWRLDLSQIWYIKTRRPIDDPGVDNEGPAREVARDIDEVYRTNMVDELRSRLHFEPLPSIDVLNLCIHLFFTRFNLGIPLIHVPTFRARSDNVMLVLMICAAGTMTLHSDTAIRMGAMLFEGVNKVENAWTRWAAHEEMKRAAIILHIHDAEIAALYGQEPIFRHKSQHLPTLAPPDLFQAPDAATWALRYRSYGESRQPYTQVHQPNRRLHPEARFQDQDHWTYNASESSMLISWATLSGTGGTICEYRSLKDLSSRRVAELETDLAEWFTSSRNCCQGPRCRSLERKELPFCLIPLWHHTFMALTTDFDLLELAVGREGTNIAPMTLEYVKLWISSPASKRCLLHALCMQHLVAAAVVDAAAAMYTPRILFSAALCWCCYIHYLRYFEDSSALSSAVLDQDISEHLMALPEVRLICEARYTSNPQSGVLIKAVSDLKHILRAGLAEMKASTLCVLESTLRRLATNGISQKFADLVQAFIVGDTR